jgi:hypothetical protein
LCVGPSELSLCTKGRAPRSACHRPPQFQPLWKSGRKSDRCYEMYRLTRSCGRTGTCSPCQSFPSNLPGASHLLPGLPCLVGVLEPLVMPQGVCGVGVPGVRRLHAGRGYLLAPTCPHFFLSLAAQDLHYSFFPATPTSSVPGPPS